MPLFPSLSEDGWITSSQQQGDYLFAQFFASDYSQTQLYLGEVASMAWVIQETQGDVSRTCMLLRDTLQKYFQRYFPRTTVEVNEIQSDPPTSSASLRIYLSYTDQEGTEYIIGRLIELMDSKVSKIVKLNNTGE